MNFIAPRADTAVPHIQEIPLSRLALAPENVRKTPPDPQADTELKASIAALGLLENLVVRPDEPDGDGAERYTVVAGGRRLRAMRELAADGVLDAAHPVPCQIRSGEIEPAELSLAENVVRIAMHPADQVVAFSKLVQAGQPVSSIAARFGVSERMVEQRLRLGNAAPELLDAYRARDTPGFASVPARYRCRSGPPAGWFSTRSSAANRRRGPPDLTLRSRAATLSRLPKVRIGGRSVPCRA